MKKINPKKIPEALYYKYRLVTECYEHEQTRLKLMEKEKEMLRKDYELLTIKLRVVESSIVKQNEVYGDALEEYDTIKAEVEDKIKMKLNGCSIDPKTFTVIKGV